MKPILRSIIFRFLSRVLKCLLDQKVLIQIFDFNTSIFFKWSSAQRFIIKKDASYMKIISYIWTTYNIGTL